MKSVADVKYPPFKFSKALKLGEDPRKKCDRCKWLSYFVVDNFCDQCRKVMKNVAS